MTLPDWLSQIPCLGCSCICDDVSVEEPETGQLSVECELGRQWLCKREDEAAACLIEGQPATVQKGIEQAAMLLTSSNSPLVYGLSRTSIEACRQAVAIADRLRATLDIEASPAARAAQLAYASVGRVSATLGEVRDRSNLIVFWGTDASQTHPRHGPRYSLPDDRQCVVVGAGDALRPTTSDDTYIQLTNRYQHCAALTTMLALLNDTRLDPNQAATRSGHPLTVWQELVERLQAARYGAIFFGDGLVDQRNYELLFRLVRRLNADTRCVCLPISQPSNVTGAVQVLGWSTGYPFAVSFGDGSPRFGPAEFDAETALGRAEVDAALIVASDPLSHLGTTSVSQLRAIPKVVFDWETTATSETADIFFRVAKPGVSAAGSAYRSDGVPLRLRAWRDSAFSGDDALLTKLNKAIEAQLAHQSS